MGKFSVPEEIRKLKPEGSIVKRFHDKFYVYEWTGVWSKEDKKSKAKSGKLIGKITLEDGFIRNGTELTEEKILIKEYGTYSMLENLCSDILGYLKLCFDIETANTIFSLACINFTEGLTALKNYKKIYDYSYLSERFPNIHISKNTLSLFLEDLGSKLNPTYKFYDLMIEKSSKNYAIDGHVIPSFSKENDLTKFGNKYSKIDSKQMNLLALFDVITKQPIMSKIYDGSQLDKTSVKEFLTLRPIENTLIIMDSGFFSKENIELFSTNSNSYIIPLSENYIDYKEAVKELKYDGDFVYESCEKDKKLINYYIHKQSSGVSIYVFQDKQLADKLKIEYLSCIKNNIKGYSDEKLKEIEKTLGVIVLQTNSESLTFKEIFEFYKKRWGIETYFNGVKNSLDFTALGLQNYYEIQGLVLILQITGMMWQQVIATSKKSIKKFSIKDVITETRFIKILKLYNEWKVTNMSANVTENLKDYKVSKIFKTNCGLAAVTI